MGGRFVLRGADIVLPDRVVTDGAVVIDKGRIEAVLDVIPPLGGDDVRWISGLLAPGFIDLHSDALEREVRPRPTAVMPLQMALSEFDRKLAGQGITTMLHAVSVTEEEGPRSHAEAERIAGVIAERAEHALIRHVLHIRYEITDVDAAPALHRLLACEDVRLLSFMDHTPDGRQFKSREEYVAYYSRAYGWTEARTDATVGKKLLRKQHESRRLEVAVRELAEAARASGAVLASHDDDSAADIDRARALGVTIAEFPMSVEAATAARKAGLHVVMGAPNLLRGGSTGGNLAAHDAYRLGLLDVLCSDYYPAALLHAVIGLVSCGDAALPGAFRLVTLNPAGALGRDDTLGSIEPGKVADLIVIDERGGVPVVTRTLRDGRDVLSTG